MACIMVALPRVLGAQTVSNGAYVVRQGANELVRETYAFDGTVLTTSMLIPSQQLVIGGRTVYDDALSPTEYVATGRFSSDSVPFQTLSVTFADSAHWEVTGAGAQAGATPLVRPYSVFRNLSNAHLAVILLRYDRDAGGRQPFNLWMPGGAVVLPVTVELSGTEGVIDLGGVMMNVRLSEAGWLLWAEVQAQNLIAEWTESIDMEAAAAGPVRPEPPEGVGESVFTFPSGELRLEGTLALPLAAAAPVPVAVIVAGSGPTDRNGNSRLGVQTDTYAQLAWRLAERGIATMRYDKRVLGATVGSVDMSSTSFDDFAGDVIAAVDALRADDRFSGVVVLGHSEGAGLAVRAANRGAAVTGIGLLAGMGRPFLDVLREQLARQLDEEAMATFDQAMASYLAGDDPADVPQRMPALFVPVNRLFMRTAAEYDPQAEVASVPVPVLIVQGETDVQIGVRDAELLLGARPDATLVLISETNHTFKHAPSLDIATQTAQYTDPTLPIAPELVDAIVAWMETLP
jgi:pimeloyl-ACP methyl ester carboxylesterase